MENNSDSRERIPGLRYLANRFGDRGLRIVKRVGIGLAAILVLVGLIGYLWLPGYAKNQLESALTVALKRPVTIEQISISPYTLSATVYNLKVGDVLTLGRFQINLSSASLARRIPVIEELGVSGLHLHLVRESENRLNVSDLLDEWTSQPASNSPTPEFVVGNITLDDGQVEWVDKVENVTQNVSDIRLGVPFIANVPSKITVSVEPVFSAKLNGAPINLAGKSLPFAEGHDTAMNIDLDGFDLTRIVAYAKLPATIKSALLDTHLQVHFKEDGHSGQSLSVSGDAALRNLKGEMARGKLAIDVPLLALTGLQADILNWKVSAKELALKPAEGRHTAFDHDGNPMLRIENFALSDLALDMRKHAVRFGALQLDGAEAMLARTRDGTLDVAEISLGQPERKADIQTRKKAAVAPVPEWSWSVDKVAVSSGKLRFSDEAVTDQVLSVTDLSLTLGRLDNTNVTTPVSLKASVNDRGTLAVEGSASTSGKADLKLDAVKVDLAALQGWVTGDLNAILTRGDMSFGGDLHVAGGTAAVSGDVELADFNVLDRANSNDMLRWKQLKLGKLKVNTQPFKMSIGEIALRDFYARLLINSKGQLNLNGIRKNSGPEQTAAAQTSATSHSNAGTKLVQSAATPASAAVPAQEKTASLPVSIGRISLAGGTIDFSDQFIKPNYSARLTDLNGRIGALVAGTPSPVEISGKIDHTAPLKISGKVDPLSSPVVLDIQASAKGIELPALSAYSGRYLGYTIAKGKLSVDVSYRVEKGKLSAENRIFLDQLTLGEKVESPDALDLPLGLAIALLQDSRGEIDINLPIRGSLDDPKFNIGGIVVEVLVNFIVKAVTSPFALLGSLFGGGEDLSNLIFPPGQALITPDGEKRLQAIAKAMTERPGIKIEITGNADPETDRDGLKRDMLNHKIKALKLAEQTRHGKRGSMDDVVVSPEEYPKYLAEVYDDEEVPNKPRNAIGFAKDIPPEEMEKLLLDYFPATETELAALADRRSQAVQAWLLSQGVTTERIFLMNSHVAPKEKDLPSNRTDFSLH